ncbi:Aldo/keto reductase, partial [Athelia psychrophila]
MTTPTRKIGQTTVSAIGFGAMGIGGAYGKAPSDEERFQLLDAAHASGSTHWDTADIYMDSEALIGKWLKRTGKRNDIFLATKFGFVFDNPDKLINGSPEYAREALDRSLQKLGVDYIDLFYLHRVDSTIPIEHTVAAMAEGVKAGKVKYLGLSECSAASLRRAHAVHPIAAVQCEYSPFTLDIEDEKIGLLKAARELGVAVVAYAPLGRGLITGSINSPDDLDKDDWRRSVPRYSPENFPNIVKLAQGLKAIGERNRCTTSQVALAWLLSQGDDIIPIPGTTKIKYLEENVAAAQVHLAPADLKQVRDEAQRADAAHGDRYPSGMAQLLYTDSPELN